MESRNPEIRLQQDEIENLSRPCSSSSTTDLSLFPGDCNCSSNCTECNYRHSEVIRIHTEKKKRTKKAHFQREALKPLFVIPDMKDEKSRLKTNRTSKKIMAKSKNELLNDYCPYSSDNCGCSSGCTDCDYGLYTYTTENKSKLKSKGKKLSARSSSSFKPLTASERSRRTATFRTNVLKRKKAKPKRKTLESCYPESSGSCSHKLSYIKHELQTTVDRKPKIKKTSARNLRKLKTMKTTRTLKLCNKKITKNAAKVSENKIKKIKNRFPDSNNCVSNNYECNSDCTDCGKRIITKRKKLKNRSKRTLTNPRISRLPSVIDELVKNEKDSKQTAEIHSEKSSLPSGSYSENDSYFTDEDCC